MTITVVALVLNIVALIIQLSMDEPSMILMVAHVAVIGILSTQLGGK